MPKEHNTRTRAHINPSLLTFTHRQFHLIFFGAMSCGVVIGLSTALLVISGGA